MAVLVAPTIKSPFRKGRSIWPEDRSSAFFSRDFFGRLPKFRIGAFKTAEEGSEMPLQAHFRVPHYFVAHFTPEPGVRVGDLHKGLSWTFRVSDGRVEK